MADGLIQFTPRAELDGQENLLEFIAACRQSPLLNANQQFDECRWKTPRTLKGKNGTETIIFSTLEAAKAGSTTPGMPEPFASFAKACIVYLHDRRPSTSYATRLRALRCLEAALSAHGRDRRPTAVNTDVLDTAVTFAYTDCGDGAAYRTAGQLQIIADLMRDKFIIQMPNRWLHGQKKPRELGSRIDDESMKARRKKLLTPAAIRALAGVFELAVGVADNVVTSATALMICAPERVNEVARLSRLCLIEGEGEFAGKLGLRWSGSKGMSDHPKWIPDVMAEVAREAIVRLLQCSSRAHAIAAWYVENPDRIYLAEDVQHLRTREHITLTELSQILWGKTAMGRVSAAQWCHANEVPLSIAKRAALVRFEDAEKVVLGMLPPSFPYLPGEGARVRVDEALCLIRKNDLHPDRASYECMFDVLEQGDIGNRLGSRNESGIKSIFARYGFFEDDGTEIRITSHRFRHYLNTLAQLGGLTDAEIAAWSGRKETKQNDAYNHLSSDQLQAPVRATMVKNGFLTLTAAGQRSLVFRSDFKARGAGAAHTTDFGYCVHDFAAEPCQLYRDCLNCTEQVCVKGELHKEANLRAKVAETKQLLASARAALGEAEFGADLWVLHQQKTLDHAEALLAILLDPRTAAGAAVRLKGIAVPMPVGHAAQQVQVGSLEQPGQRSLR